MTTHTFQSEVKQLLDIVIHSLYSEKEIFLRELISNSSDACDKLRFQSLTDTSLLKGDDNFRIDVNFDADAKTITISDNGIGLTEEEAIEHLGTIAKSGTKAFLEQAGEEAAGDLSSLIGQFGVGFYSAFVVADNVVVESRSAHVSSDEGVRWESSADGNFVTESIARPQRGTTMTLHLREDALEFADRWRLQGLIKKYSDFVTYPIHLPVVPPEPKEGEEAPEIEGDGTEQINEGKALWTKSKSDISDEDYNNFYKSACKAWDEPASRIHFNVEGSMSFSALLYFPTQKPFDLHDHNKRGLSLYVRRVFIMDDCEDLLPAYLRFMKGVVDSDDLPLNVSRELLQQQGTVTKLRKQLVKRILDHLAKLARSEDDADKALFTSIDNTFGPVIREGLVQDIDNKDKLSKIIRYQSSWTCEQEEKTEAADIPLRTGLEEYISRMPEGQEDIYFVTAANLAGAKSSPHLEGFLSKGYEVLYLIDPVDEWVGQHLTDFNEKKLVNVLKGSADLEDDDSKKELEDKAKEIEPFLTFCTGKLDDSIKEVRLSSRLTDSPCCIVADEHGMTNQMEAMMKQFGQAGPEQKRILELNPEHELVQRLIHIHGDNAEAEMLSDHILVLRDQALLAEGSPVKDPAAFARRVQGLMSSALG